MKRSRDYRAHPVASTILAAGASGGRALPSVPELDALKLSRADRERVQRACQEVAQTFDEGSHQEARQRAAEHAEAIVDALPSDLQRDDYLAPAEPTTHDPAALADAVPRW